jgi:DmsE family decaheme c-type cytochrome
MGRVTRALSPMVTIAGAVAVWLVVVVAVGAAGSNPQQNNAAGAKPPTTAAAPAKDAPTGYVGEQTCITCHEEKTKGYHGSKHARTANPRTPAANKGCESCHGPGQAHVEGGGDKSKIKRPSQMTAREVTATCTTCHNRTEHSEWAGGKHDARNVSCITCHSVHDAKGEKALLKKESVSETCVQCHRTQVSKIHKSSHMPVREGKMECTTCHNPHGSQNVKMLREGTTVSEACASCHTEKRGPFLWEHMPVRENCTTCHDAHGSNNERMLVAKLPMLCQRCHIHSRHPATVYDQTQVNNRSNRVAGRSCVNCHQMIHGSNHPTSGKVFTR